MRGIECAVHCTRRVGDVPPLSRAVMGNAAYSLLRTGVRLQRALEDICEAPLLRRVMDTLGTGIGVSRGPGVYSEDADGNPVYDFTFFDQIVDVIANPSRALAKLAKSTPFMGVGFMPEALSSACTCDDAGKDLPPEATADRRRPKLAEPWMRVDRFPPKDYDRWGDLVHAAVQHAARRYGAESVSRWYWDFWNEPDLRFYWLGTQEELFKTYDYAAAAIKKALPSARVGGLGTAGGGEPPLFRAFLDHCASGRNYCTGGKGAPLDFITFHMKGGPTGAKGVFHNPWEAAGYERRHPSLTHIIESTRRTMRVIASVDGAKGLPVFLTECDVDWGTGTSIYANPNMHYRNSEYFPAFQCALTRRMLDVRDEFPDNPIERLFLDTFYIPGHRVFEGQRTLITGEAIDKPILNGLRLLGKLGRRRLAVTGEERAKAEVLATAADGDSLRVMAVNFDEAFDYDETHLLRIRLQGLEGDNRRVRHYRIDRHHSNSYTAWLEMGRPVVPTDDQLAAIQERMGLELAEPEFIISVSDGAASVEAEMPPHSVSLWCFERA